MRVYYVVIGLFSMYAGIYIFVGAPECPYSEVNSETRSNQLRLELNGGVAKGWIFKTLRTALGSGDTPDRYIQHNKPLIYITGICILNIQTKQSTI